MNKHLPFMNLSKGDAACCTEDSGETSGAYKWRYLWGFAMLLFLLTTSFQSYAQEEQLVHLPTESSGSAHANATSVIYQPGNTNDLKCDGLGIKDDNYPNNYSSGTIVLDLPDGNAITMTNATED